MKQKSIVIIIPALNEERTIGKVIDEIPYNELNKSGCLVDVIVVDGKSSDRTVEIARRKGAQIIIEPLKGKSRALITAFKAVSADYIFFLDADYTYPATYIPEMLELLEKGHPIVIGSRLRGKREKSAMQILNLVGNYLLTWMASLLYWSRTSDLCTGYWGLQGDIVKKLKLSGSGFQIEAELFTELAKNHYPLIDIPINYRKREGQAKIKCIRDGFKIGWLLISRRFK